MPDGAGLYRFDHLVRHAQHRAAGESGHDRGAAVDAGERPVLGIAAQLQSLLNNRREVLIFANVGNFGIGYHGRGEHAVCVAPSRRHQAVGGKQHRRGKRRKFLLLVLPRRAEIALEMGILFQFRVAVGGEHFTVGVDVDTLALGLLQQQLQVVEVMAGDDDERPLLHGQRNGDRGGCAIAFGVRLIKERHTLEILLADLHHNGQQLVHAPVLAHGKQRLGQEAVHFLVGIAQHHGVMGIGRHAAHAKENQGFETADILLRAPELLHIVIVGSAAGGSADGAVRNESRLFSMHPVDQSADGFFIKIHIGNGGEQPLDHQPPCIPVHIRGIVGGTRQPHQRAGQLVLKLRHIGGLAAYPRFSRAAGTERRLLTLKTEHFVVH